MLKKAKRERHTSYAEVLADIARVEALFAPSASVLETTLPPDPEATLLATPAGTPRSAAGGQAPRLPGTASAAAGAAALPPGSTPKSKTPLYGALAAGVVVLGVVAFLASPKPEKLTKAEIYAQQREAERQARATVATATQANPFLNTLGMKFVPVPITGGPTNGQRVLFSVWETRVQDYAVFATETRSEWPKVDFEQGPTHPAVMVNWEDATAFCAWLTERERKASRLGAQEVYRLPSDHEWSCAVGIGEQEEAAKVPGEKDQKIADVFPLGSTYPPPEKSGNYWSAELVPLLAAGKYGFKGELTAYRDGFATTAPVGSYAANRFGLHDVGGNAWEWCEDWFEKEQTSRVMRGASWDNGYRGYLLSSERFPARPASRGISSGFRCVVATSAPAAPAPGASAAPSEAWQDVLHSPEKLTVDAPAKLSPAGLASSERGGKAWVRTEHLQADGAIRVRAKATAFPSLRLRETGAGTYILTLKSGGQNLSLWRYENGGKRSTTCAIFPCAHLWALSRRSPSSCGRSVRT